MEESALLPPLLSYSQQERLKLRVRSFWQRARTNWSIFARNRLALFGLFLLGIYFLMAVLYPLLMRTVWPKTIYNPVTGFDPMIFPNPSLPSKSHLLGTDVLGRDVLSILMAATTPSLIMAMAAALTAALVGTMVGAVSAYYRGYVDGIFSHLADLSLLAPAPIIMVVIGFMLDISPLRFGVIYGLLVGFGSVGIILRSHAITVMKRTFIEASQVAGGGALHVITRHLVPHILPLAAVNMLLTVTGAIFASGFIAFMGLSRAQLNWGSMIYDSFTYQAVSSAITWNVLVPAALSISLFAASFYFIALGLSDVVEPRRAERLSPIPRGSRTKSLKEGWLNVRILQPAAFMVAKAFSSQEKPVPKTYPPAPLEPSGSAGVVSSTLFHQLDEKPMAAPGLSGILPVTILVAKLEPRASGNKPMINHEAWVDFRDSIRSCVLILQQYGGTVNILERDVIIASFGLRSYMPPRAGAVMSIQAGLDLIEYIREINHKPLQEGQYNLKAGVGIASGLNPVLQSRHSLAFETVLASLTGQTASALQFFTRAMPTGGMLISEETYQSLASVRHHFVFGRQGPARLPGENVYETIYEVLGRTGY